MKSIALTVNGKPVRAEVAPRTHLADFLREQLLLTGTHLGCEHGICGACTVEIDGQIARSCITYAVACDGARVRSIEGFDDDPLMTRLRKAFTEEHALQCGYCTPGMLIAARDLVRRKNGLSRGEIRSEMSGNLCRCTGYMGIVSAIERVMAGAAAPAETSTQAISWLGPAPGPAAAAPQQSPSPATAAPSRPTVVSAPAARVSDAGSPISVTVSGIEEIDGATRLSQSFVLRHPREAVWKLISDPQAVARCMPGMSLEGPAQGETIAGRMEVRIGPIAASFTGEGRLKQIASECRQVIEGQGGDRKSGSRASGSVDLRLTTLPGSAGEESTRVDAALSYVLTGPLAQVGRSAIARDLVRRIGEAFAHNLDAQLRQPGAAIRPAQLHGFSLLTQVLLDRVRALFASMLGRRR